MSNPPQKPKRLEATKSTLRRLFLLSGNICAFPNCEQLMIDIEGNFIGQLCHIEAALPQGERFNQNMTNDERRSFDNLMLMCPNHHSITNNTEKYTVQILKGLKTNHESKFLDPAKTISKKLKDHTNPESLKPSVKPIEFLKSMGWDTSDECIELALAQINEFLEKFRNVPAASRRFSLLLAKKAIDQRLNIIYPHRLKFPIPEILQSFQLSENELDSYIKILEKHRIIKREEDTQGQQSVVILGSSDFNFLYELAKFCINKNYNFDDFTVELKFNLLDEF